MSSIVRRVNKLPQMRRRRRMFRRNYPRLNSISNIAGKVLQLQSQVNLIKGLVNSEMHMYTKAINPSVPNTGTITILSDITAGDDNINRNGNSILGKYISTRYTFDINASATTTHVRLVIFVDKAGQGSAPAVTDVLQASSEIAPINNDNSDRFVILLDRMHTLSINGNRSIASKHYRKLNFHLKFDGTTSSDYDINAIYVLVISSETTNTPSFNMYSRIGFYDN